MGFLLKHKMQSITIEMRTTEQILEHMKHEDLLVTVSVSIS